MSHAHSTQPLKIQLAIQGGGAKIVALMAALAALEHKDLEGKIEVTRIVGASAGAIAGAFYASGKGKVDGVVNEWRKGNLRSLLESFTVPKGNLSLGWRMIKTKPIWDATVLHNHLAEFLKTNTGIEIFDFEELRKRRGVELKVVTANMRDRKPELSAPTSRLIPTLIDSAALPYFFRKWGSGGSPIIVDGGIADNLPASNLPPSKDEVSVSIAFKRNPRGYSNPTGFLSFTQTLFDTTIESSSGRSAMLHPNTYFIETSIGTFEFERALQALHYHDGRCEYDDIVKASVDWFLELHRQAMERRHQKAISESISLLHPWQTDNPTALALMRDVWTAIEAQFGQESFNFHEVELRAVIDNVAEKDAPNTIIYNLTFEPGEKPLYCYWLGISDVEGSRLTENPVLTVESVATRAPVAHVRVPLINPKEPKDHSMGIFFTPPLVKGQKYRLLHKEVGLGLMSKLSMPNVRKDELGIDPSRVQGSIENVRLVVQVPEQVSCSVAPQNSLKAGEIIVHPVDGFAHPKYRTYVVEGRRVVGLFAVDILVYR